MRGRIDHRVIREVCSDAGVCWENGDENQLHGKVIATTFDLGRVESITGLRALAIVPNDK